MRRSLGAIAGTVGPLAFYGVLLGDGATRPGHRPLHDTISELLMGPRGWIETANFVAFGLLFLTFAWGLRAGLGSSRPAAAGRIVLTIIGAGVVGTGVFHPDAWPPSSMSVAGLLHLVCAVGLVFAMLPVASGLLSRAFAADPHWRGLARFSAAIAATTLVLLVGGLALMSPPGSPPRIGNRYAGLIERTDVAVFLAWQFVVAVRLGLRR